MKLISLLQVKVFLEKEINEPGRMKDFGSNSTRFSTISLHSIQLTSF